jgi:hypothetical protein
MTAQDQKRLASILDILSGIDAEEADSQDGWWPTSVGAEFGAEKLRQIKALFADTEPDNDRK